MVWEIVRFIYGLFSPPVSSYLYLFLPLCVFLPQVLPLSSPQASVMPFSQFLPPSEGPVFFRPLAFVQWKTGLPRFFFSQTSKFFHFPLFSSPNNSPRSRLLSTTFQRPGAKSSHPISEFYSLLRISPLFYEEFLLLHISFSPSIRIKCLSFFALTKSVLFRLRTFFLLQIQVSFSQGEIFLLGRLPLCPKHQGPRPEGLFP